MLSVTANTKATKRTMLDLRAVIVRRRARSAFDTFTRGGVKHSSVFNVFGSARHTIVGVNRKFHLICEEKCPWLKAHGPKPKELNTPNKHPESSGHINRIITIRVSGLCRIVEKQLSSVIARARG